MEAAAPQSPSRSLWLFPLELVLSTQGTAGTRGSAGNRSLLHCTCLAGMQHHLKEEGQLFQGHIHHLSWIKGKRGISSGYQLGKGKPIFLFSGCLISLVQDKGKTSIRSTSQVRRLDNVRVYLGSLFHILHLFYAS